MQSFVAHLPVGVKLGNTKREQMTSAVHPTTDIAKILRHFRFVPGTDIGDAFEITRQALEIQGR
jgi:hypothetical protein